MREHPPMLARAVLDRAARHRSDPQWLSDAWQHARILAVTPKSATAVSESADGIAIEFRAAADIPADAPRRYLGRHDGVVYFAATVEPDEGQWVTLRELGGVIDDLQAELLVTAIALEQWHQRHTHCPRCGTATHESDAGWTRTCPRDGSQHFPRTDPAVIMLIHDGGDRALLGRGAQWPAGRFSTLAGFVEPGESLEAAVAREVGEEVGVAITDIRYVASQPWPFPSSLMLGFTARVDGEDSIELDLVEMAEAAWFTRAEVQRAADHVDGLADIDADARLQFISPGLSISRYLIDCWLAGEL
ncbi:MAG TPA: NAD(+) diphosphatase [Jatrophihabitantaceae bacterium]